jgi:hypothetical protein
LILIKKEKEKKMAKEFWLGFAALIFLVALVVVLCLRYIPGAPWHPDELCAQLSTESYDRGLAKGKEDGTCTTSCTPSKIGSVVVAGSSGIILNPGFRIYNILEGWEMRFQQDGNIVVYKGDVVVDATNTANKNVNKAEFTPNGAFRIYDNTNTVVWELVPPAPGNSFTITPDGQFQISNASGDVVWKGTFDSVQH